MKYIKLEIHEIIQRKTLKVTTNILEQQSEKKTGGRNRSVEFIIDTADISADFASNVLELSDKFCS